MLPICHRHPRDFFVDQEHKLFTHFVHLENIVDLVDVIANDFVKLQIESCPNQFFACELSADSILNEKLFRTQLGEINSVAISCHQVESISLAYVKHPIDDGIFLHGVHKRCCSYDINTIQAFTKDVDCVMNEILVVVSSCWCF